MLAPDTASTQEELEALGLPWLADEGHILASEKLNGIRCLIYPDREYPIGRSGDELKNRALKDYLKHCFDFARYHKMILDGELYSQHATWGEHLRTANSIDRKPTASFDLQVFDGLTEKEWLGERPTNPFYERGRWLECETKHSPVRFLEHAKLTWKQILETHAKIIERGGEGLILRSTEGGYKHGRCTTREGIIWKFKAWKTFDGVIVDVKQQNLLSADAQLSYDQYGRIKRDSKATSRELVEACGALKLKLSDGREVDVGSGFTDLQRRDLWRRKEEIIGLTVEIRGTNCGSVSRPLAPTFLRFKDET